MIAPARRTAFYCLRDMEERATTLPDGLALVRQDLGDPRDVALASDIVIGTTRWRGTLDHLLSRLSSRPLDALDDGVLHVLRLSAYQLLHLTRVPASAVVNDAVSLVRAEANPRASGYVNALLRRLADPASRPPAPERPSGSASLDAWTEYLSAAWAHPPWLVRRWVERLGPEAAEARLRYNQSTAPMTLRPVEPATRAGLREALAAEGVSTEPTTFAPEGVRVTAGNPVHTSVVREGRALVQDEGSQLVALFAAAAARTRVLDVCAAPGGKATALAATVGPAGLVVAGDVRRRRVELLHETVRLTGARNVAVVAHDARAGLPYAPVFDLVVVDAPCSGLGTLRRDPDVKWRRAERDLARFARAQTRLLDAAARVVAPRGRLVYATCSSEPEENEEIATAFLAEHTGFTRAASGPEWTREPLNALLSAEGALSTAPERHGLDVFFAVAFQHRPVR